MADNNVSGMYSLVPQDDINSSKFIIRPLSKDVEGATPRSDPTKFDPFTERKIDNPTTDFQTLTHLVKSTLGSGIMSMPYAFKASGIAGGILGGLFTAAISTHTSYILVDCAHKLYVRARKTKMDYADVVECAFDTGPENIRKYAKYARKFILIWLFTTYFGACVSDNILISTNYGQVYRYYTKYKYMESDNSTGANSTVFNTTTAAQLAMAPLESGLSRSIMGCLLVPIILFVWVPDLKYLAPISTMANFFMATVIGITCYYLVQDPKPMSELSLFQSISEVPTFFGVTLFAMANIGVMMPLENNMKTPRNFLGTCGVLNRGMFAITFVYLLLGALGYMKYGNDVDALITANLPVDEIPAQIVKILIGTTVLLTFSLQFYVCREMVWARVEQYFPKRPLLAEYIIRALLVIACVSLAIALPMIGPVVTLVGAFGFSLLGIICPAVIELLVYWELGYGRCNWKALKNAFFIIFGFYALICGTQNAIKEIVGEYY